MRSKIKPIKDLTMRELFIGGGIMFDKETLVGEKGAEQIVEKINELTEAVNKLYEKKDR